MARSALHAELRRRRRRARVHRAVDGPVARWLGPEHEEPEAERQEAPEPPAPALITQGVRSQPAPKVRVRRDWLRETAGY